MEQVRCMPKCENKDMKERFWFAYYWLMVSYLVLALVTMFVINQSEPSLYGEKFRMYSTDIPSIFKFANEKIFFEYIDESTPCHMGNRYQETCSQRTRELNNFYPFILVFLMTLIRFIFTGKHIWQRP